MQINVTENLNQIFAVIKNKKQIMKNLFLFSIMSLTTFICIAQNSQDEEDVKKVVMAFQADFNDGTFKNVSTYTTADWEHIGPHGVLGKGPELLKTLRSIHQAFLKGVTMTIENISIRFVTPDVAIANVVHKIALYVTPDGKKHENERQTKTYIVVKQNNKWLLTHDQITIIAGK